MMTVAEKKEIPRAAANVTETAEKMTTMSEEGADESKMAVVLKNADHP